MQQGTIALWMYRNEGGEIIQNKLKHMLEEKGHTVINDFDMRECYVLNGNVFTKCGNNLSKVDVFYHMNADEQTAHQNEILQTLDQENVIVINNWDAFSKAKDKFLANLLLRKNNIRVPSAALFPSSNTGKIIDDLFETWGSLLFKPRSNHGGKGIIKFDNKSTFMDFTQTMDEHVKNYYLEEYIDFDKHDYRVEVFNNEVVGGYCRTKTHEYKTNIACGGLMTPLSPPAEFNDIALAAANVLGINTTIVDMIKSLDDEIYVLEVNPIMGIFVEAGMNSKEKSVITKIDPVYANDDIKLNKLVEYLDQNVKQKLKLSAEENKQ